MILSLLFLYKGWIMLQLQIIPFVNFRLNTSKMKKKKIETWAFLKTSWKVALFAAGPKCLIIQHSLSMFFLSSQATLILSVDFFFQIQREYFFHFLQKTLFLRAVLD